MASMSVKSFDRPKALRCVFTEAFHEANSKRLFKEGQAQKIIPARAWDDIRIKSIPKIEFPYSDSIFYNALWRFLDDLTNQSADCHERLLAIAFFIRTTPDPFDDLNDSQIFDQIQRDKKYELELPDIFRLANEDKKVICCKQEVHYDRHIKRSVILNTHVFHKWSLTNGRIETVRRFMGLYCMNLLRCISNERVDSSYDIKVRLLSLFAQTKAVSDPPKLPRPSDHWLSNLKQTFHLNRHLTRCLLSLPLEYYFVVMQHETGEMVDSFRGYAFTEPLAYAEMYPLKLWLELTSVHRDITPKSLIDQLDGYKTLQHELRQLDFWLTIIESFGKDIEPDSEGRKFETRLWKFSRLFDYSSFLDLSLERSYCLSLLLTGMLAKDNLKESPINCLNIPAAIRDEYLALGRRLAPICRDSDSDVSIEIDF